MRGGGGSCSGGEYLIHSLLADAAAHLAQQRCRPRAIGSTIEHILVRVKVGGGVEGVDVVRVIQKHSVSVARVQADEMQRGFKPLDFLRQG